MQERAENEGAPKGGREDTVYVFIGVIMMEFARWRGILVMGMAKKREGWIENKRRKNEENAKEADSAEGQSKRD